MSHLQYPELVEQIRQFLSTASASLTVHEPDSRSYVDFFYIPERHGLKPVMRLTLGKPTDEKIQAAARARLPLPRRYDQRLHFGPLRGTSIPMAEYVVPVRSPEEAANTCLAIFREVYDAGDGAWLWITPLEQPDDWPVPLPKPRDWPPKSQRTQ